MKIKVSLITLLLMISFYNLPLFAEENIEELKAQIQVLQNRVDELESSAQSGQQRWDPFAQMQQMQEQMDQMFQDSFFTGSSSSPGIFSTNINMSADFDMTEEDDHYRIVFDMKGMNKDKMDIQVSEHSITVKGEQSSLEEEESDHGYFHSQSFGTFMKTIPLPRDADSSQMKTEKQDDQLIITLPKK